MFDTNSIEFKRTAMDLANQVSVFRRVIAGRNQSLLDEEDRFQKQMATAVGNTDNIVTIHYRYVADEKKHIYHEIKSELLYTQVISDTYDKACARIIELANEIKTVDDPEKKKEIRQELRVLLSFIDMYEAYVKDLKSMENALKGFETHNDRYVDYIRSNIDTLKDATEEAAKTKKAFKEKKITVELTLTESALTAMPSYDNIKLEKPEVFNLDYLEPEALDFFIINFVEEVARQIKVNPEDFKDKEFDVTLNGKKIENVTYDTFTNTVLAYVANQRKDNKAKKEEDKKKQQEIDSKVPDKPSEKNKKDVKPGKLTEEGYIIDEDGEVTTLDSIMARLTEGLDFGKGDDWKFTASNVRVNQAFAKRVATGNVLYNIVALAPAVVSYPFQLLHKGVAKLAYTRKIDKRITQLKERLANLTDDELMIIYKQYKGGNLRNYQKMPIVNTLIQKRINQWLKDKEEKITSRMISIYNTILTDFKRMIELGKEFNEKKMSEEEYDAKNDEYYALAYGKADLIKEYLQLSNEKLDLEIGGSVGFADSIRAYKTGMSQVGFRFRKIPKENDELNEEQAKAYEDEIKGVATGDDFLALSGFVKREKLIKDNTLVDGLLMKRDKGLRSYNPMLKPLNYTQDPFVSDLMRTVVLVASGINIYTTITRANELENLKEITATQNQVIQDQQAVIGKLNNDLGYAQQLSNGIQAKSGAVIDARIAQINEANLAHTNTLERAVLDQTNWHSTGAEYRALDDAAHATYNNAYTASQATINEIADGVTMGDISHAEAMAKLTELSRTMEDQFVTNYKEVFDAVTQYAKNHPQFDLTAPTEGLEKVINTSNNISIGNQAVDEAFQLANEISNIKGVSLAEFQAIATNIAKIEAAAGVVPSQSMLPGLMNSFSAALLALGVKNRMNKYNPYKESEKLEDVSSISDEDIAQYDYFNYLSEGATNEEAPAEDAEEAYEDEAEQEYEEEPEEIIEEEEVQEDEQKGRTL